MKQNAFTSPVSKRNPIAGMTNEQLVSHVFNFAPRSGAMAQAFAMDAIAKHARAVAERPIEELRDMFGPDSFISAEVWQAAAQDWVDAFAAREIPNPSKL